MFLEVLNLKKILKYLEKLQILLFDIYLFSKSQFYLFVNKSGLFIILEMNKMFPRMIYT